MNSLFPVLANIFQNWQQRLLLGMPEPQDKEHPGVVSPTAVNLLHLKTSPTGSSPYYNPLLPGGAAPGENLYRNTVAGKNSSHIIFSSNFTLKLLPSKKNPISNDSDHLRILYFILRYSSSPSLLRLFY